MVRITAIMVALLFLFSFSVKAELKIGYVDLQRALNYVEEGVKAKKLLEEEYEKKKNELKRKEDDIKKLKDELLKQDLVLSDDAKKKKQEEYNIKLMEFQKLLTDYQKDIQTKEMEYTNTILTKMKGIVEEIGKQEKYTLILEKTENGVIYALSSMDITDRVIKTYNDRKKK